MKLINFQSTVLLNANVALLSTPIVYSNNGTLFASPAAVAIEISIVASLASIIIGLLLVRQVRISAKDIEITADDAVRFGSLFMISGLSILHGTDSLSDSKRACTAEIRDLGHPV